MAPRKWKGALAAAAFGLGSSSPWPWQQQPSASARQWARSGQGEPGVEMGLGEEATGWERKPQPDGGESWDFEELGHSQGGKGQGGANAGQSFQQLSKCTEVWT